MAANVEVNKVFKLHPKPLQIENNSGHLVDIPLPESHIGLAPIACRLMSAKKRKGMVNKCMLLSQNVFTILN